MANNVVGFTNDELPHKVTYTGGKVEADENTNLLKSEVRIDNDPESKTFGEVRAYVYHEDDVYSQSNWEEDNNSKTSFIKNRPFKALDENDFLVYKDNLSLSTEVKGKIDSIVDIKTSIENIDTSIENIDTSISTINKDIDSINELKQDKLVDNINIKTIYNQATKKNISLLGEGNLSLQDLVGEVSSSLVDDVKVNGNSVVENKVAKIDLSNFVTNEDLDNESKLQESIVVKQNIGGYEKGDIISENTPLIEIINKLLSGSVTEGISIYHGIVDEIPTTKEEIESLTLDTSKTLDKILEKGKYVVRNTKPVNQYFILAIPSDFNIDCYQINQNGFPIDFVSNEVDGYFIYHQDHKAEGTYRLEYLFEEI